jgi:hypothetical protein
VDMCVERACIALLLGNTQKALHELGLAPHGQQEAGSNPTQQAAQQYVLVSTGGLLMLLPGTLWSASALPNACGWPCTHKLAGC